MLNRGNGGQRLFDASGCYDAFSRLLEESRRECDVLLFAYCLMPNHWHLLARPLTDVALSRFLHRLTLLHAQRWHRRRGTIGRGHLYQGRFKSFPIGGDKHFLTVVRYIERNPLRAGLVEHAQDWRWSSLGARGQSPAGKPRVELAPLPIPLPGDWLQMVNGVEPRPDLDAIRGCLRSGRPYGAKPWTRAAARRLGVRAEPVRRGRPPGGARTAQK